jgi:plastocyanin
MAKGILIVVITLAVGAAIIIPFWQTMINHPPAASTLKHEEPPEIATGTQTSIGASEETKPQPKSNANANANASTSESTPAASAGPPGTPLTILEGSSVQGSPDFDPDTLTVKKGDKITVTNKDTLPHTVTSGASPSDPNSAKQFDTSIIEAGATADIETTNMAAGDYPFHCAVHPYMMGKIVVQ